MKKPKKVYLTPQIIDMPCCRYYPLCESDEDIDSTIDDYDIDDAEF